MKIVLLLTIFIISINVYAHDDYQGMTSDDFMNHPDFIYIPDEKFSHQEVYAASYSARLPRNVNIIYVQHTVKESSLELWTINPHTRKQIKRLTKYNETHNDVDSRDPIRLKDGRIVYSTDRTKNGVWELWMLDPNKPQNKTRLTGYYDINHPYISSFDPIQLQDGRVLYRANRTRRGINELWILDPNNPGRKSRLTRSNETHKNVNCNDHIQLKDGRILYKTNRTKYGVYEYWILELDTGASYPLTSYRGGIFKKRFTSLKHISDVLPSSKSDFIRALHGMEQKPVSKEHLPIYLAASILIDFTTSKIAREKIAPQLKMSLDYLKDKYSSSLLSDIVTTPTQIKIVVAAIDSLLKRGHFPNIKKGNTIKKRLAMELVLNSNEIDYVGLSEDLESYQDLFERLTLNPETKAHGMVIQTFLSNWSQQ